MKKWIVVISFVSILIPVVTGCEKMQPSSPGQGAAEDVVKAGEAGEAPAITPGTPGTVATIVVGNTCFDPVEIAKTDEERARGLMGRESIPANGGMWFEFERMGRERFWMKDTLIPLDLIYVDEVAGEEGIAKPGKVIFVIENAAAGSTEILESAELFRYVLEVPAGTVSHRGIKVGDAVVKRIGGCG